MGGGGREAGAAGQAQGEGGLPADASGAEHGAEIGTEIEIEAEIAHLAREIEGLLEGRALLEAEVRGSRYGEM